MLCFFEYWSFVLSQNLDIIRQRFLPSASHSKQNNTLHVFLLLMLEAQRPLSPDFSHGRQRGAGDQETP